MGWQQELQQENRTSVKISAGHTGQALCKREDGEDIGLAQEEDEEGAYENSHPKSFKQEQEKRGKEWTQSRGTTYWKKIVRIPINLGKSTNGTWTAPLTW